MQVFRRFGFDKGEEMMQSMIPPTMFPNVAHKTVSACFASRFLVIASAARYFVCSSFCWLCVGRC